MAARRAPIGLQTEVELAGRRYKVGGADTGGGLFVVVNRTLKMTCTDTYDGGNSADTHQHFQHWAINNVHAPGKGRSYCQLPMVDSVSHTILSYHIIIPYYLWSYYTSDKIVITTTMNLHTLLASPEAYDPCPL